MFCRKCGNELDDDAVFCEKCGNSVIKAQVPAAEAGVGEAVVPETGPEKNSGKKPSKWIMPVVGGILAMVTLIAVFLFMPKESKERDSFYHDMNFNSWGCFAYDAERLYFITYYNEGDEDVCLFSTDYKGVNKQMIWETDDLTRIRVSDGKIYYVESREDCYNIGVINTDGTEGRTIVSFDKESTLSGYAVHDDKLYYIVDSKLNVCDLDGENGKVLVENASAFVMGKKELYYVSEDIITKFSLKKETSTEICKVSGAKNLALNGDVLYFECNDGLSSVDVNGDGTVVRVVRDSELGSYVFNGDYIYYKQKYDDDEIETMAKYLADDDSDAFTYKLFFMNTGVIYRANMDGSGVQEVENASESIVYSLFTYPEGLYCRISAWTYNFEKIEFE